MPSVSWQSLLTDGSGSLKRVGFESGSQSKSVRSHATKASFEEMPPRTSLTAITEVNVEHAPKRRFRSCLRGRCWRSSVCAANEGCAGSAGLVRCRTTSCPGLVQLTAVGREASPASAETHGTQDLHFFEEELEQHQPLQTAIEFDLVHKKTRFTTLADLKRAEELAAATADSAAPHGALRCALSH